MMKDFTLSTVRNLNEHDNEIKVLKEMMEIKFQNQEASLYRLVIQIGQLTNHLADRTQGALPSNIERNSRE